MTQLLNALKQNSLVENSKGGLYNPTSWNANLDFFSGISRGSGFDAIRLFNNAYEEDRRLALANLLYVLDIRGGKGERAVFKNVFTSLCIDHPEDAVLVMHQIPELGRWDYVLCALNTPVEQEAVNMISAQLAQDLNAEHPSLLAKWLPSVRTHNVDNMTALALAEKLGMTPKKYRKTLAELRSKINIVEKPMTEKRYDVIDFEHVPTKAMLKYRKAFDRNATAAYGEYLDSVKAGEKKINTTGMYCYEIIRECVKELCTYEHNPENIALLDQMWKNQKDFLAGNDTNVLVMADTSGSMTSTLNSPVPPLWNSIGLAIYTAQRNHGYFHNHFMTFSANPMIQEIRGETILDIFDNIRMINDYTDVDAAFELLLNTAKENSIPQEDMPSHLIIISDMEFDEGTMSHGNTNFHGWKKAFKEAGYTLPRIVFWNVAGNPGGMPATKFDNDVAMISGFNTSILDNILKIENFDPVNVMTETLAPYLAIVDRASPSRPLNDQGSCGLFPEEVRSKMIEEKEDEKQEVATSSVSESVGSCVERKFSFL